MNVSGKLNFSFSGNPEMAMADAFIRQTGCHVYLTGKAGTGKTTFLHQLKASCHKQMVVTAPTGVAAVNAGGVTLHSFFQLPFGPYIPGQSDQDRHRFFRFSKEKRRIIKGLDLLVIDEISMVRADLLDAVDAVLRRLRRSDTPFGGVQLLLIGDLYQLPPVAKPDEWQLLQQYYNTVYFFSSQALAQSDLVTIELEKIYRQSDEQFIRVLNAVRENRIDPDTAALLEACAQKTLPDRGYITLTTHNRKADTINHERLSGLDRAQQALVAEVSGEFPEHAFPTPNRLVLKQGAQVMFLRNDPSPDKAYYNGKIGRVAAIVNDRVFVDCEADGREAAVQVEVAPVEWENIAYTVNEADQTIQEEVVGRFRQVPLKLAWAVTIHKSQGLTFDRAIVDATDAFAHGQTYVALSRCRTLEGLVLSSPMPRQALGADPSVTGFMAEAPKDDALKDKLETARFAWQQQLLFQCFDCTVFKGLFFYVMRLLDTHRRVIQVAGMPDPAGLRAGADDIFAVSDKFLNQLRSLMSSGSLPAEDPMVQERTRKAAAWFGEKFALTFGELVENGGVETDNKAVKKQISNGLDNLIQEISVCRAGILSCHEGFSPERYLAAVSRAGVGAVQPKKPRSKTTAPNYSELDIEHPELFKRLREWRAEQAKENGVPHYMILQQKVLVQICVALPCTEDNLLALKGVGPGTVEKYGADLIRLIKDWCDQNDIQGDRQPEPVAGKASGKKAAPGKTAGASAVRKTGADTKSITLSLFAQGMSAEEIAEERGLAVSTIQGHLCYFIETGEVDVDRLVSPETQAAIEAVVTGDLSWSQIKAQVGDEISYGEIKAVLAHRKFLGSDGS